MVIGVTGHRVLAALDKIAIGIGTAIDRIEQSCGDETVALLSSLAEGADRLVVYALLERLDARLVVPLPLPRDEYEHDFTSAESVDEFRRLVARADEVIELPPAPSHDAAYEAAGFYIADHCDVLIAVWDGQPAQERGGTADVVARARARKLPIAWVHAGNRKPGTNEPTSLGEEQGMVTFEDFPAE